MPYLTKRIPVVIQLNSFEAGLFFIQFLDLSHQLDRLLEWSIFFITGGTINTLFYTYLQFSL
jgi:hypothetical protein